jgi:Cft2 family RNA processing exonuclease
VRARFRDAGHIPGSAIVQAGVDEAGRVRHHLERNMERAECSILFTGFQAEGILGRRTVDGVNDRPYGAS